MSNRFMDSYVRMAQTISSRQEGEAAISRMAQGMTMDYMVEFAQESAAIQAAEKILTERFGPKEATV